MIRSENFDFYQNQNGIAVKGPDKDKVLKLDLQELCGIWHTKLTISADKLIIIKWWVDSSDQYAQVLQMQHHTIVVSLGNGVVCISLPHKEKDKFQSYDQI